MRLSIYSKILVILLLVSISFADNTVGLIQNDDTQSYDGYVLFGPKGTTSTYLIDSSGNLINKWESDFQPSASSYLLEDGNLLRATKLVDPNGGSGGFQVKDWDGNVIWEYTYGSQHHDIEPLPNGNVLLITNHTIENSTALNAGRDPNLLVGDIVSLTILEIANNDGTGEIVWQWNAWDHIIQDYDIGKPNYGVVSEHPELINLNYVPSTNNKWIHPNSIDYNEDFDQIMISARTYNELWVIDHSTTTEEAATNSGGQSEKGGDLLYRWGNPATYNLGEADDRFLYGQHDVRWIDSGLPGEGNITAFNNGLDRPEGAYSSIVEITPPVDNSGVYSITAGSAFEPYTLTWSYTAAEPTDMYSSKFSSAQRLPNGNTFICNGVGGELLETTTSGDIVWKYINPESTEGILTQGDTPSKNDVYMAHKYSPNYPGFDGKDLTAGDPIETYNVSVDNETNGLSSYKLEQNYPNPFNPITNIEFNLDKGSFISLVIYDIVGNKVKTLVNEYREPGMHSVEWDSFDNDGNPVSSGMYFYKITIGSESQTKKMMLMR